MKPFFSHPLMFLLSSLLLFLSVPGAWAEEDTPLSGEALSLDSCRRLALANHKALRMAQESRIKAGEERRAARTSYLPKLSATTWMSG